jgi:serpin B
MYKRICLFALLVTSLCLSACSKQAVVPAVETPAASSPYLEISKGSNNFALSLYKQLSSQDKKSNLLFSPFSIWTAFSMLYEGAEGQTLKEMRALFGFIPNDDQRRAAIAKELAGYRISSSQYGIGIDNSLWVNKNFTVKQYYKFILEKYYFATVQNTVSSVAINKWVSDNTFGKIQKLFDASVDNSQLVLVNTVYFKSKWMLEFDKADTKKNSFFITKGNPVTVDMMSQKSRFSYYENLQVQVLKMKYREGKKSAMIVILPKDNNIEVAQDFLYKTEDINSLLAVKEVQVFFPKFEIDYAVELKNIIAKLGLTACDYSKISDSPLMISQAIHKAYIKVDDEEIKNCS